MRFAVALVTLLIAGVLVATGVAQRTILKPADHVDVVSAVPADVRYVVIPGPVLRAHAGGQQLHLAGGATAFAAYAKPADITAWLAGQRYAELRVAKDGTALKPVVRTAPAVAGWTATGGADPDGSDLWLDQRSGDRARDWKVDLPSSTAMIVAADGSSAAPSAVRVSWRLDTATPFAVPLIVAGAVLAVVGLLLYVWALVHLRRGRGPRRRPPGKAQKRPLPPKYRPQRPVSTAPGRGRRSVRTTAAHRFGGLALLLCAALIAGPVGPATAATAPVRSTASVGEQQARRIVSRVAAVEAAADRKLDAKLAATRLSGPALELRRAAYAIRKKDRKAALPQAIPTGRADVRPILPEATGAWPRTLFVVVADAADTKAPPVALVLVQRDPRADYEAEYSMSLQRNATLPDLPSALLGAARLDSHTTVLSVPPVGLAEDFGALLLDDGADQAALFDRTVGELVEGAGETAKKKAAKKLGGTAGITFKDLAVDPDAIVAMATADSGALVAVDLDERWTVKPKQGGVTVKPSGGTKVLSKTASTSKGIASVYGYQLLFSVPSAGSRKPIVLLGYAQGLVSAKEL